MLRVFLGNHSETPNHLPNNAQESKHIVNLEFEELCIIESNIDDMSPEVFESKISMDRL